MRRRHLKVFTVALLFVALAGATYQGVATSLERHRFLRSGGLVDGGGYQLHIYCTGEGSPTVVLEAAAGSISSAWALVQPDIARVTRVCSYDRSGLGWSEGDGRYVPERVPDNLRTMLEQAHEQAPFVLVGQELGAAFARLFAARNPAAVPELVLIDDPVAGSHPPELALAFAWPWLARVAILRTTGSLNSQARELPGTAGGAMNAFLNRPDHLTQAAREIRRFGEVVALARAATLDRDIKITLLASESRHVPAVLVGTETAAAVTYAVGTAVGRVRARPSQRAD
jgi:pimeloyl-ACP methyl ester carboxylesterase